jgi:hypothetical protein
LLLAALGVASAQFGASALDRIGVDTSRANIPTDRILSGGPPPQGIPALGFSGDWLGAAGPSPAPAFVSQDEAALWLAGVEPVIVVSVGGATRIYPLQILTWHEIANDTLGGVPIAVSFCPLCNSALAFDRRVPLTDEGWEQLLEVNSDAAVRSADEALDAAFLEAYADQEGGVRVSGAVEVTFGVSGTLFNSNLLMFDTASSTLWSQILGEGNVGTLTDTALLRYPAQVVAFTDARAAFPEADVLSRDTGFGRSYGRNPYLGYDDADSPAFLFDGVSDGRLPPKSRVVSVERGEASAAYPFEVLTEARAVNDAVEDLDIAVFWGPGTASALDRTLIADGEDVGAVGVFRRDVEGRTLTFGWDGELFVDRETGSSWNLLGQAVAGELEGVQLRAVPHDNTLWFAWAAFRPDTRLYLGQ